MKKNKYIILFTAITLLTLVGCKNKEDQKQVNNFESNSTERNNSDTSLSTSTKSTTNISETTDSNVNNGFTEKDALKVADSIVGNFEELLSGEWESGSGDKTVTINFNEGKITVKEMSKYNNEYLTEGTYSINTNKIAGILLDISEKHQENEKMISEITTYREYTDLFQNDYEEDREKGITVNINYKTTHTEFGAGFYSKDKEFTGDSASIIYINNFKMKIFDGAFLGTDFAKNTEYSRK